MEQKSFHQLCESRRSLRRFSDRRVSDEDIRYILECARIAPSACNFQPWEVIMVDDRTVIERLSQSAAFGLSKTKTSGSIAFIAAAPVVLALCIRRNIAHRVAGLVEMDYSQVDLGIFGEHIVLAATERGIGSCWIGMASHRAVRKVLNIPKGIDPITLIALGYPEDGYLTPPVKNRMELGEFCYRNEYGREWAQERFNCD